MQRVIGISRFLLPMLVAGSAAAIRLHAGEAGAGLVLMMLGGALLGGAAALMLESVAVVLEWVPPQGVGRHRRAEHREEREGLLRSIKDLENDAALHKIDEDAALAMASQLRERALELLREEQSAEPDLDEQIQRELERRLGGGGKPAGEAR